MATVMFIQRYSNYFSKFRSISVYCHRCMSQEVDVVDEDDDLIEKRRNKSGLRDHVRNRNLKMPEVLFDYQLSKTYKRRMYAKFGKDSGFDPGMMWPTKEELQEEMNFEAEFCPPLQNLAEKYYKKKTDEEAAIIARTEELEKNMAKLSQWKAEIVTKYNNKLAAAEAQRQKKERLIEEVRNFFGYRLDPKDPKFQAVLEQKEAEEKKVAKEAKKKDRLAKEMARLANMAQQPLPGASTTQKATSEDKD